MYPWGPREVMVYDVEENEKHLIFEEDPHLNHTQIEGYFDHQLIDHFDILEDRTWRQRYWMISNFYKKEQNSPIFLLLCGEYTCPGLKRSRLFPIQLAKKFNAMILILEHRFYGKSQPFEDKNLSVDRLRFLTIDQTLADIAYFISWVKYSGNFSTTENTKVITIGGSYAGALSAWFREKYPHLTVGALGSSAIIDSVIEFPEFDEQVYYSLNKSGAQCPYYVQRLSQYVENQLNSGDAKGFKKQFDAEKLTNEEFLLFWADSLALFVQYGYRTNLCDLLDAANKTVDTQFNAIKELILKAELSSAKDYAAYYLSNEEFDTKKSGARQWAWQSCAELGLFNTAPSHENSLRSQKLNITFYKNWCENIFGEKIWPRRYIANIDRGGKNIKATNLIITNGCEDPWQQTSLTDSNYFGVKAFNACCENCAHCADLQTPRKDDPWALWWIRQKIKYHFSAWLNLAE